MNEFLSVSSLTKVFELSHGFLGLQKKELMAVYNVSFELERGEVLGLVGESGSGKSTLGRCLLRLIEPTSGKIEFSGTEITALNKAGMRDMRRQMQMVFQDAYSSLDPRKSVRATLIEARTIQRLPKDENSLIRLMELVGLTAQQLDRYPHEFSGGQRQRIGIARALSVEPKFIIADEPVSALDVSIQAQIINLLADLKSELNLGMLFIGHDLAVVEHVSDRVMVLYLGKVMEVAPVLELFSKPRHPYTEALLSAAPQIGSKGGDSERIILAGEQPSPASPPPGCVFHTRCRFALSECASTIPDLKSVGEGHFKACIRDDVL